MKFDPASNLQDYLVFGEFGDVNPSITDSATYTFMQAETMEKVFQEEVPGCYLYSRHWNPMNKHLADAIARIEGTEAAWVTGSGMGAISSVLLQLCNSGDEIVSNRTIYGGTYAFMKNYIPKFNIKTNFVNILNLEEVEKAITPNTKVIYTETMNNPLLEISDIPALVKIANKHGIKLVVDNSFTPMIFTPAMLGAHIVIYSLTKFYNGTNDCVAGAICSSKEFINSLVDVNNGTCMLLGPVLDSLRSSTILKNIHSLHIRMKQHSKNASYLSEKLSEKGVKIVYPGMKNHPQHELMTKTMNTEFGYGGMIVIDVKTKENSQLLMEKMQTEKVGYFAVSLGYFKTLFSSPGSSTSSEVPKEEQEKMGLTEGLIRFSVGLDNDIEKAFERISKCLDELKLV